MKKPVSRRSFLENITVASTGIAMLSSASVINALTKEDHTFKGYNPYASTSNDMRQMALFGKHVTVTGKVYTKDGTGIVPNALIEVWHLSPNSNKYRHQGKLTSDAEGKYQFKTDFPNREDGKMPRIYFKISSKTSSYATELLVTDYDAYITGDHWERNNQLGQRLFPVKETHFNDSTIKFNISI